MEAPDKIYFDGESKACKRPLFSSYNIEYTCTDAFIEKAIGWIDYNNRNGGCNFDGWEKDFKNYMEGE